MIALSEIRKKIRGSVEDARFMAWMELYSSNEAPAKEELEKIIHGQDPTLKILFIRFLGNVNQEKAILYLMELLQDENSIVMEQAKRSFDKNKYEGKTRKLLSLLYAPSLPVKYFAIERTSQAVVWEIVAPLLNMLEGAGEEFLLKLLVALRYLPTKMIIPRIAGYLKDTREEVRFRTVLIFGALYEAGVASARKYLVQTLLDSAPRIRQAVLWSLCRVPSKKDLKLLYAVSSSDSNPLVRQESLLEFSFFPVPEVICHLLAILTTDKNKLVTLRGEAVLLSMPLEALIRGLKKGLEKKDAAVRDRAFFLLAQYEKKQVHYYDLVVKNLKKAPADKEKIIYLQILGELGLAKALPLLEPYLYASALVAYTTMQSVLKILNHHIPPLLKYLQDIRLSSLLKQTLLRHLLRKGNKETFSEGLVQCLIGLLKDDNLNMRYLAAQVLVIADRPVIVKPLLEAMLRETDPIALRFLQESIFRLIATDTDIFFTMLQQNKNNRAAMNRLLYLLKRSTLSGKQILLMLPSLLGPPLSLLETEHKEICADFVFSSLVQNKISMDAIFTAMQKIPGKEILFALLIGQIRRRSALHFDMSLNYLTDWIDVKNRLQTDSVIELMGLSRSKKAIPVLVSILCSDAMVLYHKKASNSLNSLLKGAA